MRLNLISPGQGNLVIPSISKNVNFAVSGALEDQVYIYNKRDFDSVVDQGSFLDLTMQCKFVGGLFDATFLTSPGEVYVFGRQCLQKQGFFPPLINISKRTQPTKIGIFPPINYVSCESNFILHW